MKINEAAIKKQILDGLRWRKIFCWNNRNVGVWNKKTGYYIPSQIKGVADIIGLMPDGRFLAIEVKCGKNKQNENQRYFEEDIKKNNGIYFVAYSWEEVDKMLFSAENVSELATSK